jgi:hypothetical protein
VDDCDLNTFFKQVRHDLNDKYEDSDLVLENEYRSEL